MDLATLLQVFWEEWGRKEVKMPGNSIAFHAELNGVFSISSYCRKEKLKVSGAETGHQHISVGKKNSDKSSGTKTGSLCYWDYMVSVTVTELIVTKDEQ